MRRLALSALAAVAAVSAGIGARPAAAQMPSPAILTPGQTVSLPDFPASASVVATQVETFGSSSGPDGTLTEYVVDNVEYSPYGPSGLVFAFGLQVTGDNVAEVSLPGFAGFDTAVKTCNVAACVEGTGVAPTTASRSTDGDIVSFLWNMEFSGGSSGFSVYTNATSYYDPPMIEIFDLDGNVSFAPTFLPSTPLPSSWLMLFSGLLVLGYFAYRGSKKSGPAIAAA